jgi:hypothetical protein
LARRDEGHRSSVPKKTLEDALVRSIVDCDPSILAVLVLRKEGGVSSVARSPQLPEEAQADLHTIQALGTVGTVILGAAENAEKLFGEMEFVLGAFKNGKILLVKVPGYDVALAVRLTRLARTEYVYAKISKILALG